MVLVWVTIFFPKYEFRYSDVCYCCSSIFSGRGSCYGYVVPTYFSNSSMTEISELWLPIVIMLHGLFAGVLIYLFDSTL